MAETIAPMTIEHLESCVELYTNVFNSEPWNESWTPETAKERLADLMHTSHFMGFFGKTVARRLVLSPATAKSRIKARCFI